MAPPEKKQKVEEKKADEAMDVDAAKEEKKEPEELEGDAPECAKPKLQETITFNTPDTTLNVLQSTGTHVLMSLSQGGIQHFLAGARANIGVSKGRYMFEVSIVQLVQTQEEQQNRGKMRGPDIRIGFSAAGSELILGETAEGICFLSEGVFLHNKERTRGPQKFGRDNVVAVLLNLDKDSKNFNTISLFKDGVRACQPIAVPEKLRGKALYPHVTFKGVSLHMNFGSTPAMPLPFKCRMLKDATLTDVALSKPPEPEDGKYSVLFPVSMPDEGSFDWLDMFLEKEKSKHYIELSDRTILEWAEKSGIFKPKGYSARNCHDKPDMIFQVRELDDCSMRKAIYSIAPLQKRNYIIMEVQGNLLKETRKDYLQRFSATHFKKIAHVMMGDPILEFKKKSQQFALAEKQSASDKAFELKKLEEKRKREMEKKAKAVAKARRQAERKKKREVAEAMAKAKAAAEEKAKAIAAAKAAAEGKEPPKEGEEKQEEEKKEEEKEEKKDEPMEEDSEEEAEEEEKEDDEQPPKAELTAEEKSRPFRQQEVKDLSAFQFSTAFTNFSVPETDEGFDDIKYEWSKTPGKCKSVMTEWKLNRKICTRVEDLTPSTWFHQEYKKWQTTLQSWHSKLSEYKAAQSKKAAAKAQREAKKLREKAEKELKEKKAAEEREKAEKEGKTVDADKEKEEKETEKEKEEEKDEEPEEEEVAVDFSGVDVFGVADVQDIGGGMPLCREFSHEDWTMLALRFELHLLAHAFKKDVDDDERPGIHIDHLGFYYQKYYKRNLTAKEYSAETYKGLIELVNDTMHVGDKDVVVSQVEAEMENAQVFLKLTEEARRYRMHRIDLGEGAELKLTVAKPAEKWPQGQNKWQSGTGGGGNHRQQQQPWQYAAKEAGFQTAGAAGPYSKGSMAAMLGAAAGWGKGGGSNWGKSRW